LLTDAGAEIEWDIGDIEDIWVWKMNLVEYRDG
jgi:hypothetical protein